MKCGIRSPGFIMLVGVLLSGCSGRDHIEPRGYYPASAAAEHDVFREFREAQRLRLPPWASSINLVAVCCDLAGSWAGRTVNSSKCRETKQLRKHLDATRPRCLTALGGEPSYFDLFLAHFNPGYA